MKLNSLFVILLLSFFFLSAAAQKEYKIELKTDNFPYESSWEIRRGGKTIFKKENLNLPNHLYSDTISLDSNFCHTFLIFDKNSNGICCQNGEGYFRVYENGNLILEGDEFETSEYLFMNCPSGTNCESPYPVEPGKILLKDNPDNWYLFIPDSTGLYQFSTCNNASNCKTKIWGYSGCYPSLIGDDRPGTIFYGEPECTPHREISALLEKDLPYYIRIGREDVNCTDSIWWELSFKGQVLGCMDPTACNFDPLATQDDGFCIFNGDPDCPQGPDLAIDQQKLKNSLSRREIFNNDPCLNSEGCLKGYGNRTVITFDTWIENKGEKDFFVGRPPENIFEPNNTWEFDDCHNHWHYEGYAEYILFDTAGAKIPVGVKNGFCIMDVGCNGNKSEVYHCDFQGISSNCFDIYDNHLDCQWIDITDVEPGQYTLAIQINTQRLPDALGQYETGYENNWAQVCIEIFEDTEFDYKGFTVLPDCDGYVDCTGTLQGNAQQDCTGECNGTRKQGDLDQNDIRDGWDVLQYVEAILNDNLNASQCTDLNNDQKISVVDAVLLQECALNENSPPTPGHNHIPCDFPYKVNNPFDSVWLYLSNWNEDEKYIDLELKSPYKDLSALQFDIEGIGIETIEILLNNYNSEIFHNDEKVIVFSKTEDLIDKTLNWIPFLRIHYTGSTNGEICLLRETVVNDQFENVLPVQTNCFKTSSVSFSSGAAKANHWQVYPNPARDHLNFFNSAILYQECVLEIWSQSGLLVQKTSHQVNQNLNISTENMQESFYFYRITNGKHSQIGTFVLIP
jgi:hypothetical protein